MKKSTALLHMLTLSVSWSCSGGGASKDGPTQSDGTGGGGGDEHSTCAGPEPSPLSLSNPGRVDMPVAIEINGLPAVVGEPGLGRGGREWRLSLFKLFIADPFLVGDDDTLHPAELVTVDGTPLPYALELVDADAEATQLLRLKAEAGSYAGLRLSIGVPAACNTMDSTAQVYPLNPDSDMFWTWGSQFMFVRVEGSTRKDAGVEWMPFLYHVGFDPAFLTLTLPGRIHVGTDTQGPSLVLDIDLMLETGGEALPTPKHEVPDGWIMDNLESNGAFSLR